MDKQQERWNRIFEEYGTKRPIFDDWLNKYEDVLEAAREKPVIDLGCGFGNDALYLHERGYRVIACDFAEAALRRLCNFISNPDTRLFDLRGRFPFEDSTAEVIIADLCLHYFSKVETENIISEIRRILISGGWLLCRVNSVNDLNYGAGQGTEIEPFYFDQNGNRKRFFDETSLRSFFAEWKIKALREAEMRRYEKIKIVWELSAQKL